MKTFGMYSMVRVVAENEVTHRTEFERYFKFDEVWEAKKVYNNMINNLRTLKQFDKILEDPTFDVYEKQTRAMTYNCEDHTFDTVYTVKMEVV